MSVENCPAGVEADVAARYVAGTLPADDVAEFELHLFDCSSCVASVRDATLIAAALRTAPPVPASSTTGATWSTRLLAGVMGGGVLAAAAIVALLFASRAPSIGGLGAIEPVAFERLDVRFVPDSAARFADEGMAAYQRREYRTAIARLGAAAVQRSEPGTNFYLGVSHLLVDDPGRAAAALRAALLPAGNAYAEEARFYLAKALLRMDDAKGSLEQLAVVAAGTSPLAAHARALADSVRAIKGR